MKPHVLSIAMGVREYDPQLGIYRAAEESHADAISFPNDHYPFSNTRGVIDHVWWRFVNDTELDKALQFSDLRTHVFRGIVDITRLRRQWLGGLTRDYQARYSEFAAGWRPNSLADGVARFSTRRADISENLALLAWLRWWAEFGYNLDQTDDEQRLVLSIRDK